MAWKIFLNILFLSYCRSSNTFFNPDPYYNIHIKDHSSFNRKRRQVFLCLNRFYFLLSAHRLPVFTIQQSGAFTSTVFLFCSQHYILYLIKKIKDGSELLRCGSSAS